MKTAHGRITMYAVLLSLMLTGAAQAAPAVDLGTASGNQCAQVIIPVTLTNDGIALVAGVATDIGYNSEFLTPVKAELGPAGSAAGKSVATNIVTPGLYRVGVFSSANVNNIGNGIVANVTFEINCSAPATSYQLSNDPSASTATGGAVNATGNDGTITVTEVTTTTTSVIQEPVPHITTCITCHPSNSLHGITTHQSNCNACHAGSPGPGNVKPDKCVVCHPSSSPGACNLINLPSPVLHGATCLTCHVDCDSNTTNNHMSSCVVCHPTDFSSTNSLRIHGRSGHSTCSSCHPNGTPGKNVTADKCSACHPLSGTGDCKIVDVHAQLVTQSCLDCHKTCSGGAPITTTTSTISNTTTSSGGGSTSTTTSTGGGNTTTSSGGGTTTSIPGGSTTTVPPTSTVPPNTHTGACLTCHFVSDIHAQPAHNDCSKCHNGTPGPGNVPSDKCAACHPLGSAGTCNLINFHGSTCRSCHTAAMCPGGTPTTSIPGGSSSTTTKPSTTSTIPNTHTGNCLTCHLVDDLHAHSGHNNCSYCHREGTDSVQASSCAVCHPLGSPGKCGLVKSHGGSCLTCHAGCVSGVTTTITGSSTTTIAGATTTTVAPPGNHFSTCLTCHYSSDLHDHPGHKTCASCHAGTPAKGNVEADKCIVCHPLGNAGKCNLINTHGSSCVTCHTNCTGAVTTTTVPNQSTSTTIAGQTSTTTAPPNYGHISDCTGCHKVSDLHARQGHSTCSQCHDGTPQAGNVSPGNCAKCHPLGSAGKCNLINKHGSSCIACHAACSGVTTTSTIPNPPPSCTVTTDPESVRSGFFIPLFKRIKIQSLTAEFDGASTVSIQGFRFISITSVTSTELTVLVLVPPRYLTSLGDKTVNVVTGDKTCSGTITVR